MSDYAGVGLVQYAADAILDVLLSSEDGTFRRRPGRVLVELANLAFRADVAVGDIEYHATSRAVLMLEELGLVTVTRLYHRGKAKANILVAVRLNEEI